jgi:hypothetical protein
MITLCGKNTEKLIAKTGGSSTTVEKIIDKKELYVSRYFLLRQTSEEQ